MLRSIEAVAAFLLVGTVALEAVGGEDGTNLRLEEVSLPPADWPATARTATMEQMRTSMRQPRASLEVNC
jgi:hypothetical protein